MSPAESWLAGRGFVTDYRQNFIPPPLQGVFVLAVRSVHPGASYGSLRRVQAGISTAGIPLAFWIGAQMGGPAVGLAAAALVAFDPDVIDTVSILLAESNYLVLLFAFLGVLLLALRRASVPWLAASGALLALASLSRPFPQLLAVGVPAYLLARYRSRFALVGGIAFAAAFAVLVAPWIARNQLRYGRFYGISTNAGTALALANFPALDSTRMVYVDGWIRRPIWRSREIEARFAGRVDAYGQLEWNEKDRAYQRHALAYMAHEPLHFLRNYLVKAYNIFRYAPSTGRPGWIPSQHYRNVLVALGLPGLVWFAVRERGRPQAVMVWIFLYHVAILALFHISSTGRTQLPTKLLLSFFAAYLLGRSTPWTTRVHVGLAVAEQSSTAAPR